jgi:hypothetical protein
MSFSADDIDAIVRTLREGYSVTVGGSRCHTDYYFRDGAFRQNNFDEGYEQELTLTEQELRSAVDGNAREFVYALDVGRWTACKAAVLDGDWAGVARALDGLRAPDGLRNAEVLRAVGAWPASAPSEELRAHIAGCDRSSTLYHVFMTAVRWEKSKEISARAIEWIERVEAMIGAPCERTRESFAGDLSRLG